MPAKVLKNSDIFLVNRDKKSHRALVGQMKDYFGHGVVYEPGVVIAPVEVLTPTDGAGLNEGEDFNPTTDVIKKVDNDVTEVYTTDTIANVGGISYSSNLTSDVGWANAVSGPEKSFDGDNETFATGGSSPGIITFTQDLGTSAGDIIIFRFNFDNNNADREVSFDGGTTWLQEPTRGAGVTFTATGNITSVKARGNAVPPTFGFLTVNGVELVDGTVLTFPTSNNFDKFEVGEVVQTEIFADGNSWNQDQEWTPLLVSPRFSGTHPDTGAFNGVTDFDVYTWNNLDLAKSVDGGDPGTTEWEVRFYNSDLNPTGELFIYSNFHVSAPPAAQSKVFLTDSNGERDVTSLLNQSTVSAGAATPHKSQSIPINGIATKLRITTLNSSDGIYVTGFVVNGELLVDKSIAGLDNSTPEVKVTAIDPAGPTITVDGGSWLGADTSGDPAGDTDLSKSKNYDAVLTVNGEKELEYFNKLDRVDMGLDADVPYQPVSDAITSVGVTDPNDYTFGGTVETTFANLSELAKMFNNDTSSSSTGRFTGSQNVGGGSPYKGYVRIALPSNHFGNLELQTAYLSTTTEPTEGVYFKTDTSPKYRSYAGSPYFTNSGQSSRGIFRIQVSPDSQYIEVGSDTSNYSAGVWSVWVDGNQIIYPAQTVSISGTTDLDYFREGDAVQTTGSDQVTIRYINRDSNPPTMTFNNNGKWYGTDLSGDPTGETKVTCLSPLKEPTDWIVQQVESSGTNSKLYLNATTKDNGQLWVADDNQASQPFYVVNQRLITSDAPDGNDVVFTSQNANTVEFNSDPPGRTSLVKRIWHLGSSNTINTIDDADITTYDEILDVEEGEDPGEWARDPNLIVNGKYYKVGVQYENSEGIREPEIVTDFNYFKTKSRNKYYPVSSVITANVSDTKVETQNDDEHHVLGGDLVMVTNPTDDQNPPIVANYTPTSSSILSIGSDGSNIVLNIEDEQDLKYFRPGDILPEGSSVFEPSKTMTFSTNEGQTYAHDAAGGAKMLSAQSLGVEGPDRGWPSIGGVSGNKTVTMNVYFNPPLTFDPPVKIGVVGHETANASGSNVVKRGVGVNGDVYLFNLSNEITPPPAATGATNWSKVAHYHTWSNISTLTSVQARVQGYNGMESKYGKCSTYAIYVNDEQLIEEDIVPVVVSVNIDDENGNSITVDAGEWYANPANGGNGDGVDTAPDIVVGSPVTGEATDVVSTNLNTLTLQESNDRWIGNDNRQGLNFYVAKKDIYESGTLFYSEKDNDVIGEETIKAKYGARSANIDLTKLGIYELTEQPLTSVAGYVKQGQKYQPVYDLVPVVEDLKSRLGI